MKTNPDYLGKEDIKVILRAADDIIAQAGRTMLAKILKGSREKKLLQFGLDQCPAYGRFRREKIEEVMKKIDWMIDYDFLDIEYVGKLPMIVFTERGWMIEADQRADEFLSEWNLWLEQGKPSPDMTYLKDRNREMILLFLEKIKETQDEKYIPYLEAWKKIDYKKVKTAIRETIKGLESNEPMNHQSLLEREAIIHEALQGKAPSDLVLKCQECGNRFTFTISEQQFNKQKGFRYPKRCKKCREKGYDSYY
jgi:hypothetical protein